MGNHASHRIDPERLVKILIAVIGLHSCGLGLLMLVATPFMLNLAGFQAAMPIFFPSQSGVFLVIMGIFYLMALRWPPFEWTILISKGFAVVFLTIHAGFLSAPRMIWAVNLEDALMLAGFAGAVAWRNHRRRC